MAKSKNEDMDFEIRFYEGVLEKKGDFLQALIALGDLYTRKGLYQKGLEVDKKLARLKPEDSVILYNLACSYSLLNQISLARDVLKQAIHVGYSDLDYLEKDPDLANLLKDTAFCEYFEEIKDKTVGDQKK